MNIKTQTVSSLTGYIKRILDADFILQNVVVKLEVSNFKDHSSKHLYFTLKDATSRISCMMFRMDREKLSQLPKDGDEVVVKGRVACYPSAGTYQLYVQEMTLEGGQGDLYNQFLEIKERLTKAGLFDPEKRRPIPSHPNKIAVITSPTGAAIRDIIKVLRIRNPRQKMVIYPVQVQGEISEGDLLKALSLVNERHDIDVIILSRGGGSIEDLWSFNSEKLAYAIKDSKIPVVTGVGHDVDYTIADFAADLRAATPSQAAELTIPDTSGYELAVLAHKDRLNRLMKQRLAHEKNRLRLLQGMLRRSDPMVALANETRRLSDLKATLTRAMRTSLEQKQSILSKNKALLTAYSPLGVLEKGYAIVRDENGRVLASTRAIEEARSFTIRVKDGETHPFVKEN